MPELFDLVATTSFGLEAVVARELEWLGYEPRIISTGRIHFRGDALAIARANLWLRAADRVLLRVAQFECPDFDALFDTTKTLPWERWIAPDGEFPVNGRSVKSQLSSVPAVQRTVKKAIVERLLSAHRVNVLPESGSRTVIEVGLLEDVASLTIDTSGVGLHKRGYRDLVGEAALKETLAAGLVLLSVWRPHRALVDPFCGSGTIAIEAAMLAMNLAPGRGRDFDCAHWPAIPETIWDEADQEADDKAKDTLPVTIHASDIDEQALTLARHHAKQAGVERVIHFAHRDFADLSSKSDYGCIVTNPPYGVRLGETEDVQRIYRLMPEVLRRLPTWSHHILTAYPNFERVVGQEATRRRKMFNAQIECTYYTFLGPRPPRDNARDEAPVEGQDEAQVDAPVDTQDEAELEVHASDSPSQRDGAGEWANGDAETTESANTNAIPTNDEPVHNTPIQPTPSPSIKERNQVAARPPALEPRFTNPAGPPPLRAITAPAFGGLRERDIRELDDFAGRLTKRARHFRRWPDRGIFCYRLYDRDCPDVPVVIDRYEDHAHIFELEREHSRTVAQHAEWKDEISKRTAAILEIPLANVHMKDRPKQRGLSQHERQDDAGIIIPVREAGLRFEVNLTDYTDTGLFLDHRNTRAMVRDIAQGERVLNLFCYTGSFSVYAAAGGAETTTSVDLSNTYLDWTARNFALNNIRGVGAQSNAAHRLVRADTMDFLAQHPQDPEGVYDLAIVDPPTFSNSKMTEADWEVQSRHIELLALLTPLMSRGGTIFFSNNFRTFKLDEEGVAALGLQSIEISRRTVPEDYRNERIHRCWKMTVDR
jgi:23S rRNA (guanine2445-N2)-methyltransferase / 23S rRNA (guanine2069-N7)-methyltransferase